MWLMCPVFLKLKWLFEDANDKEQDSLGWFHGYSLNDISLNIKQKMHGITA